MVYVSTHVLRFPDNTIIAWTKDNYHEQGNIIITILLLPLGHISNRNNGESVTMKKLLRNHVKSFFMHWHFLFKITKVHYTWFAPLVTRKCKDISGLFCSLRSLLTRTSIASVLFDRVCVCAETGCVLLCFVSPLGVFGFMHSLTLHHIHHPGRV